ncbi:SDR family oxidoreductase [Paraburkholderia silviterrae]|uniref:SDR family oxidoreductase n=1 Tax=Paraburkholderia silviterrae TaxID=2528715 RepID=A0A4R5M396_9BURK|nr:SDR family oxidoreductase [Paraburkholderia silviterrae]TDG20167.1 SDR family oxidoreductase [Paraburkholderia silviterrae]
MAQVHSASITVVRCRSHGPHTNDAQDGTVIPGKRGAQPAKVAAAAVWLCSPAASYVIGQLLVVDGGMTIGGFELP